MKRNNIITIGTLSLFSLTTISVLALSMSNSFADTSATTTTTITVSSACSISANNDTPHTATILPGHEALGIGNTTMTVECNDASGSAIYAIGFSNDVLGNTNMIDTSTSVSFPTGTGTSSSNWSMKLSIPTGNTAPTIRSDATYDFTDYEVVPDDYALVATFPSSANGTSNSSFSATYRAYIGSTQAPGTYTGKVKYTLVHPSNATAPSVYTISYADASNEATGLPTAHTGEVISTTGVTLSSTEPTREDYTFIGWCTVNNSADTTACSGTTYDAGDTYTITNIGTATNITLYAVWESDLLYMQDMTLSDCMVNVGTGSNTTDIGDNITVYDKRSSNYPSGDDGDYTVRYINGQCWMTQNLRVIGVLPASLSNFTGNDFNVSEYDLRNNAGSSGACGLTTNFSGNRYSNTCMHYADSQDINSLANKGAILTIKDAGAWYNFVAASAGTVRGDSNTNDSTSDICPSGWHLPSGRPMDSATDFGKLTGTFTLSPTNTWEISPTTAGLNAFGPVMSSYSYGAVQYAEGMWWSSTAYDESQHLALHYTENSTFQKSYPEIRSTGLTIRCVMDS